MTLHARHSAAGKAMLSLLALRFAPVLRVLPPIGLQSFARQLCDHQQQTARSSLIPRTNPRDDGELVAFARAAYLRLGLRALTSSLKPLPPCLNDEELLRMLRTRFPLEGHAGSWSAAFVQRLLEQHARVPKRPRVA